MAQEPDDPYEKSAEYWRQLAQRAFLDAQVTMDLHVERVLRDIASEHLALAEKIERERPGQAG